MKDIAAIILAAGRGTRIKATDQNKVALNLNGKPIVAYAVDLLSRIGIGETVVVVGFAADSVKSVLGDKVKYAVQKEQKGTADAFKSGLGQISKNIKQIISIHGDDSAFYTEELLKALVEKHKSQNAAVTLLTINLDDPTGIGRIIRNKSGKVQEIVEEKNATDEQRKTKEVNAGLYCFDSEFIKEYVNKIEKNPVAQEYYLTDIISVAKNNNKKIEALNWTDDTVWFGVNTSDQLSKAKELMEQKHKK